MIHLKKSGVRRRRGIGNSVLCGLLAAYAALICVLGGIDCCCPDTISVYGHGIIGEREITDMDGNRYPAAFCVKQETALTLGGIVPLKTVEVRAYEDRVLIPGGMLFGVRCGIEGVLVVGLEEVTEGNCPAKDAGLHAGDIITSVDGTPVTSAQSLSEAISHDGEHGRDAVLSVIRGTEEHRSITVTPVKAEDGSYRAGIWSRDRTAGIGTVTFIDPATGVFGGLGHGICDAQTGQLLPLTRGMTLGVTVGEIRRGTAGTPGELRGSFSGGRTGTLLDNTACGVIGVFTDVPDIAPIPMGHAADLCVGDATVLCTLDDGAPREYTIRIVSIGDPADVSNKNFVIEVTDTELLGRTGGIIQGMSGSPIIQNGKLIGAVTHVMVNQPQRGYGIFIENMLAAAG